MTPKPLAVGMVIFLLSFIALSLSDTEPTAQLVLQAELTDQPQPEQNPGFSTQLQSEYTAQNPEQAIQPHPEPSITILNPQSYPKVGGDWTVEFSTTGEGILTVENLNPGEVEFTLLAYLDTEWLQLESTINNNTQIPYFFGN